MPAYPVRLMAAFVGSSFAMGACQGMTWDSSQRGAGIQSERPHNKIAEGSTLMECSIENFSDKPASKNQKLVTGTQLKELIFGESMFPTQSSTDIQDGIEIFGSNGTWMKAIKPYGFATVYDQGYYRIFDKGFCVSSDAYSTIRHSQIYVLNGIYYVIHRIEGKKDQSYKVKFE